MHVRPLWEADEMDLIDLPDEGATTIYDDDDPPERLEFQQRRLPAILLMQRLPC